VSPFLVLIASASAQTPATVTLQQGVNGYEGVQDTWISDFYRPEKQEQLPGNLSFGITKELSVFERGPVGENARALIRFDLSGIKGKIVGAELVLTKSGQSPNGEQFFNQTVAVYPIADANKDWQPGNKSRQPEEGAAVWNQKADRSTSWAGAPGLSSAGVDYQENVLASNQTGIELKVPVVFPISDLTQLNEWATHPERNAGFLIKEINPLKNGCDRFYSSEAEGEQEAFRPKLILKVVPH